MTSKYEPLEVYLQSRVLKSRSISLSFKEIEEIIGNSLPKSAYLYREWWANQKDSSKRSQAKAWLASGYLVESVQQQPSSGSVSFVRR